MAPANQPTPAPATRPSRPKCPSGGVVFPTPTGHAHLVAEPDPSLFGLPGPATLVPCDLTLTEA